MEGFCEITTYDFTLQKYTTVDAFDGYGIVFEKGTYEALFPFPSPKSRYTYNWGGANGIEVDESTPVFLDAHNITLPIVIVAKGEADFWSKYTAFRALILSNVFIEFNFIYTGLRFKLRYTGGATFSILGTVRGSSQVGMRFRLGFSNDFPRADLLLPASEFNDMIFNDIILD